MAFINITTNNLSRDLVSSPTFLDNWVYIPGAAITGDWSKPVAIRSLDEFRKQFGTYSPDGSITYEYVSGILSAGLPVLFQRIACKGQADIQWINGTPVIPNETPKAECASYTYSHTTTGERETTTTVEDIKISEKWGGTYGDKMTVCIRSANNTYWLDIKYNASTIEKVKIISFVGNESAVEKARKFITALNNLDLDTVNIEVLCPISEENNEYEYDKFVIPSDNTDKELSGGTDFDYDLIKAEIPNMYKAIYDKLLFSPKFITSGGFTDSNSSTDIGDAMKQVTLVRQDCRAIIDLPLGTLRESYQTDGAKYGYTQLASNTAIPSASMYGPWLYMQVGNSQLWMPPSYAYLTVVGSSISKGDKTYAPKAGLISGRVLNIIKPEFEIGSDISSTWQADGKLQINPIMRLQTNDFVIAGNSTLLKMDEDEVNAFSESSADLAVIEIRRFIYNLATQLQYQYNNADAFAKFSIQSANYFEGMSKQGAVSDYAISNVSTDDDPRTLKIKVEVLLTATIKSIEIYLNVAYGSVELNAGGEV